MFGRQVHVDLKANPGMSHNCIALGGATLQTLARHDNELMGVERVMCRKTGLCFRRAQNYTKKEENQGYVRSRRQCDTYVACAIVSVRGIGAAGDGDLGYSTACATSC